MRRATLVACVLSGVASCSYPEFAFVREASDSESVTPIDVEDSSFEEDSIEPIDSAVDDTEVAVADSVTDVAVDTAGTFVTLLARGATWRYLDDGTTPSTNWRGGGGFDDSKWKSGAAQLGYGDGDERTAITKGPPDSGVRHTAYYFRRFISVTDAASFDTVTIRLVRDDGAVVYFNGGEVARSNMPSGTITSTTLAAGAVNGADEDTFYTYVVPATSLVEGANVLAVEVHQAGTASSDLGFDLELVGHKP